MAKILKDILNVKARELEALKEQRPLADFVTSKQLLKGVRPFKDAISANNGKINLIAEIKQRSPSRLNVFFKKLDVSSIASIYSRNGAKAISVLTDATFFGGNISYIHEVRKTVKLPVLRKDFIIDEYQIYESRYFGADAVLLIARILAVEKIKSFMHLAKNIGMETVIEIHDQADLEKALVANAKIIGINNRDLDTLQINLDTTIKLVPKIPKELIKISESGIRSNADILKLKKTGINAVLIGEAFLESKNIEAKIKEIMGETALT